MSPYFGRAAAGLAATLATALALSGCSFLRDTFSSGVDSKTNSQVHSSVPVGTTMDAAEARLSAIGFNCETRTGNFTDELGRNRNAPRFMACTKRAGKLSFACENRDEVVVLPAGGVVDEVNVVRGANCDSQPGPSLIAPNAAR
jgi:hypothetical protein